MSEWLGKPRLRREDVGATHPSLVKDFPTIADYFVEDQKPRVQITLEPEFHEQFKKKVEEKYGEYTADTARSAVAEAVRQWTGDGARRLRSTSRTRK